MLAVVGTIPDPDFPPTFGRILWTDGGLVLAGNRIPVHRGTPALLGAACQVLQVLGKGTPHACLAGDIGLGDGSRRLYAHLVKNLSRMEFATLTFHYLLPDVDWHNRVLFAVEDMPKRPCLIADAGFMYAAKMSGQAPSYDLFTPDAGELAFLADEEAPHPFYTRGFILHEEERVVELAERAYRHDNAAGTLLIKGRRDHLVDRTGVLAVVDSPADEAMEAIGGTGDTLTGIVSALIASGMELKQAAMTAARVNRLAGHLAHPTPATQVAEIIRFIPRALEVTF